MTVSWATTLLRSRYLLAVLGGLLLACAFHNVNVAGFAWIAPGILVGLALGARGKRRFGIGYIGALAHYLASLYWLLHIPVNGYPILGWIALSAFLSIFPATWVWLTTAAYSCPAAGADASSSGVLEKLSNAGWIARAMWQLAGAAAWVAMEMVIARIFGGFPWNLLGASQFKLLPLIQVSSVTGVYGVSFLVVWMSLALLCAGAMLLRTPHTRSPGVREILLPAICIAVVMAFGLAQLRPMPPADRTLNVALIQPSIPQTMIWDRTEDMERFRALMDLSRQSLTNTVDLMIWPEAAVPKLLRYDEEIYAAVTDLARSNRMWMIVGADDAEPSQTVPERNEYFNSSFLVTPGGRLADRYRKRSLVIFGEYIPLERWLPFGKWLTPVTASFTPGDKAVQFSMTFPTDRNPLDTNNLEPGFTAKTSVLICFEDNFPHLVREHVEPDTDFLVNITNNGWFGESAAQWQHAVNAIFRAIENGLPLVRCSNNGLTCWVDANGRLREIFRDPRGTVYGAGSLSIEVPLLNEGQVSGATIYRRYGDWFGWSCVAIGGGMALSRFRRR